MKTHTLKFRATDRDKFQAIRDGIKTVETRAATPTYSKIKEGDVLRFSCAGEYGEKMVEKVEYFGSVKEVFESPLRTRIAPGVKTLGELERMYSGFPQYQEKIAKHGIVAFHLADYARTRPIELRDADRIQALAKTYLEPWFGSQLRVVKDWLMGSNYKTAWVAEVDGSVMGFAIVSDKPDKDYVKLSSLVVDPAIRHHGVGSYLLTRCLDYAKSSAKSRLIVTISEDNHLAREFFGHRGFALVGTIANKYRPGKAELILACSV